MNKSFPSWQDLQGATGRSRTNHTQSLDTAEVFLTLRSGFMMWAWSARVWMSSHSVSTLWVGRRRTWRARLWRLLALRATSTWPSLLARMPSTSVSESILSMSFVSTRCSRVLELIGKVEAFVCFTFCSSSVVMMLAWSLPYHRSQHWSHSMSFKLWYEWNICAMFHLLSILYTYDDIYAVIWNSFPKIQSCYCMFCFGNSLIVSFCTLK